MLASCYDKITEREAKRYENVESSAKVDCKPKRISDMLVYDIMKYKNWKDDKDLKPDTHQIALYNALTVEYFY